MPARHTTVSTQPSTKASRFVCPVFYIFFWKIPDKVLPETEENQVVTAAVRLVFCGRIIMAGAIIMWALSLVYLLANGVI